MTSAIDWLRDVFISMLAVLGTWFGAGTDVPQAYQGYVEGEYVRVAAATGGTLDTLHVRRGDTVRDGDVLFVLDHERESAALREVAAHLAEARFTHDNLRTGMRDPELAVIEAQREQAEADLALSEADLRRVKELIRTNVAARQRLDSTVAAVTRNTARVEELRARMNTGRLAAREDEIAAAQSRVRAAEAAVAQAEWQLTQRSGRSPAAGRVIDTLFLPGEQVTPGQPVVELLPTGNLIARFFVPEPLLGSIKVHQQVWLRWGNPAHKVAAEITYISPQAEFTPPVIYSESARSKLVFLVEARPVAVDGLNLGQPLDVTLEEPAS